MVFNAKKFILLQKEKRNGKFISECVGARVGWVESIMVQNAIQLI